MPPTKQTWELPGLPFPCSQAATSLQSRGPHSQYNDQHWLIQHNGPSISKPAPRAVGGGSAALSGAASSQTAEVSHLGTGMLKPGVRWLLPITAFERLNPDTGDSKADPLSSRMSMRELEDPAWGCR